MTRTATPAAKKSNCSFLRNLTACMTTGEPWSSPDFGMLLRQYRLAAGLSQEALAERARMSTDGIGALERGYRHTPQRETLALLAGALALDGEDRRLFEAAAARPGVQRRSGAAVAARGPVAASVLPVSLTSFIGRETELDEITALVRDYRLVTITGSGGVGKTQTAIRVARAWGDDESFRFHQLAAIEDPSLIASSVASAVGAPELPNSSLLEIPLRI